MYFEGINVELSNNLIYSSICQAISEYFSLRAFLTQVKYLRLSKQFLHQLIVFILCQKATKKLYSKSRNQERNKTGFNPLAFSVIWDVYLATLCADISVIKRLQQSIMSFLQRQQFPEHGKINDALSPQASDKNSANLGIGTEKDLGKFESEGSEYKFHNLLRNTFVLTAGMYSLITPHQPPSLS